jgi:amino acid transporter
MGGDLRQHEFHVRYSGPLGFVVYIGDSKAAFADWMMIGGLSYCVSLVLANIAAALPTAGGIYYWSYRLEGEEWGPFLSWMTAWWNW